VSVVVRGGWFLYSLLLFPSNYMHATRRIICACCIAIICNPSSTNMHSSKRIAPCSADSFFHKGKQRLQRATTVAIAMHRHCDTAQPLLRATVTCTTDQRLRVLSASLINVVCNYPFNGGVHCRGIRRCPTCCCCMPFASSCKRPCPTCYKPKMQRSLFG
jgi:hypothetical protein